MVNTSAADNGSAQSSLRTRQLDRLSTSTLDVFVIGGGINGAVSAAALANGGLQVGLAERNDFASFTSQESSNLVWGGFKYLQNYEIPLVFKLCRSRNRLLDAYPTAVSEIRFLATLDESAPFPSWLAALGAVGYWGIGGLATKPPRYYRPGAIKKAEPVVRTESASAGIEYADAYMKDNDARFVWSFIRSALDAGAAVANYLTVTSTHFDPETELWTIDLHDEVDGQDLQTRARAIINGAGPFADVMNQNLKVRTDHRIVYSKGIHLVVPRLFDTERVLAFFDDTQRLFYVIPMAHRSVIGTTDTRTENPNEPVTDEDRDFLLAQINDRLELPNPLTHNDIIAERSGVRPLVVLNDGDDRTDIDWTSLSRKHEIESDPDRRVVTIFGGKLTDCLNVGEEVLEAVKDLGFEVSTPEGWYGEPPKEEREAFYAKAASVGLDRAPEIERAETMAEVLWRRHGTAAHAIVDAITDDPVAGEPIMAESDVLVGEMPLYREREMVVHADDFLRRRTKLALIHRDEDLPDEKSLGFG